jgi:acetylornithine deacetylase/succinyl-diaminopimelate desuccinylase-like protein
MGGGPQPWTISVEGNRWQGRGTADNKGQHTINLAALEQVLSARGGRLGYNVKVILETGEETGLPGLDEMCVRHATTTANAYAAIDWISNNVMKVENRKAAMGALSECFIAFPCEPVGALRGGNVFPAAGLVLKRCKAAHETF